MQTPPEISFRNIEGIERVREKVEAEIGRLEAVHPRITSCKVLVEGASGQHRKGNLAGVRIHLSLPQGRDISVQTHDDGNHAHEDVMVAIRDAFRAAERQLKKRRTDPMTEVHGTPPRINGRIVRFLADQPAGFIRDLEGSEYYFHANEVTRGLFDRMTVGDEVSFLAADGDDGPLARVVHPVGH